MDVIIEHENDCDIEKEMWKLLMFRSPLKVLVSHTIMVILVVVLFYRTSELKKQSESRNNSDNSK